MFLVICTSASCLKCHALMNFDSSVAHVIPKLLYDVLFLF